MRFTLGYPAPTPICIAITVQKHCRGSELCLPKCLNVLVHQPATPSHPKVWLVIDLNFRKLRRHHSPSPPPSTGWRWAPNAPGGHMHPRRAPLKREQWGHCTVPGQPAFPTPAASRSEDPVDSDSGMAHPGVIETPHLCIKCIKQRWVVQEPGGSFMLKHTGPGRSEDCSWWFQGGVLFNNSELEGQVSHAHGLKQGRQRDESWGIPKRWEVQLHTPQ